MADHVHDLLPAYAAGTLRDGEAAIVALHLARCAPCRAESGEWRQVARAVQSDVAARGNTLPDLGPVLTLIVAAPPPTPAAARGHGAVGGVGRAPDGRDRRFPRRVLFLLLLLLPALWALWPAGRDGGARWRSTIAQIDTGAPARLDHERAPGLGPGAAVPRDAAPAGPAATTVTRLHPPARRPSPTDQIAAAPAPADTPMRITALATREPVTAAPPTVAPSGIGAVGSPDAGVPANAPPAAPPVAPEPTATPQPIASTGAIAGRVLGPDGAGRVEIHVQADPLGAGAAVEAYTDADGRYALAVPAGSWVVHVEAPAYQLEWYGGLPSPYSAPTVDVAAGARAAGIDFVLRPFAASRVTGRVTTAAGVPLSRALVVAVRDVGGTPSPLFGGYQAAAFTDADGRYTLFVEPGAYAMGAAPSWRQPIAYWWRSATDLAQADPVQAGDDSTAAVDIVLPGPLVDDEPAP